MCPATAERILDQPQPDALETGRTYSRWFVQGELDRVWDRFGSGLQSAFSDLGGLRRFRDRVGGGELRVVAERVTPWIGQRVYSRVSEFDGVGGKVLMQWLLDPAGVVLGFLAEIAQEAADCDFLDYQTRTPLQLPVRGEWFVFWGGRDPIENQHAVSPDQRFACDMLIVRGGRTHREDPPTRNDRFHCFGEPIYAPADGSIVAAGDGVPDNVPGSMNPHSPLGNHVIMDHGNGEFSFLAHLRKGTLSVKAGDRVRVGDPLGECGNSGNSSEPHLHYHLQDSPEFGAGNGLPAYFNDYLVDGRPVARGEPTRGQSIRSSFDRGPA